MPYLPAPETVKTNFPLAFARDVAQQMRMIEEQFRRMHPLIDYFPLKKNTTIAPTPVQPKGAPGDTVFDPVYGEAVDAKMVETGWKQPHGDDALAGGMSDVNKYAAAVKMHLRIQQVNQQLDLKKYGFDEAKDLLVTIPTATLDRFGVTVSAGDYFQWDSESYEVLQWNQAGYWMNTNIYFYLVLNCQHRRHGS